MAASLPQRSDQDLVYPKDEVAAIGENNPDFRCAPRKDRITRAMTCRR